MNIFHKKCGSQIYINLGEHSRFLSTFGIGGKSLKMGLAFIDFKETGAVNASFYCVECEKNIEVDDLNGICSYCGGTYNTDSLFRLINSSGELTSDISCQGCIDRLSLKFSEKNTLKSVMRKIYLSRSRGE